MSGALHEQNLGKSRRVGTKSRRFRRRFSAHNIDELILWVLESVGKKAWPILLG